MTPALRPPRAPRPLWVSVLWTAVRIGVVASVAFALATAMAPIIMPVEISSATSLAEPSAQS
ncbi:MAG: hypothetical protein AAGJ39_09980, partial [Pseudomonadota bacterium]